jgi:hypothetical protein
MGVLMFNGDVNHLTQALGAIRISTNQTDQRIENLSRLLSGYFSLNEALNAQGSVAPAYFINDLQRQIAMTKRTIEGMLGRSNMTYEELNQARIVLSADGSRDVAGHVR